MGDHDDFQPEVKSKKRKRSEPKPKAAQAGSITSFFNSTKTEKPVINLTEEKEQINNSENNDEGEVRRSPRKRRRIEPSSNNDSNGLPSSSPAEAQEVIFIADSQSQSQPKNSDKKAATPKKLARGKTKQKEIIDESSNKENTAAPVNIEPVKVENNAEPSVTSTEGETIGRRLRPRSPVKTTDNQATNIVATSPSKAQKAAQIDIESSDPPSTSASEDNFFTRMTKRTPTKSKKKEEAAPAAPKIDEVFAVKPGEKVHDFFLAASKKKEVKLQRELQKLDEEVASSRNLAQQITGDKKPHPFLLKNPAFKMTVVKEKPTGEAVEKVAFEGPTLRLIEFPFMSHVGTVKRDNEDKMEDVVDSNSSNNSADLFSNDSQNELESNSPIADQVLFRDVLDSCVKVRLSDVVVNPIKTPATVEIKEDTPVTNADLEQFEKTSAFDAIINLIDQQQIAYNSPELTISQALNAAKDTTSADEDSDSSQSSSSKKKEKSENMYVNPKSHFVDPPTLEQDQIRFHLRTTMAKTIKQSNDAQVKANPLWTDKYAPTAVNEVCGNIVAVKFLSAWMSKWKSQKTKERKRKSKKDDDDEYMVEQLPNTVLLHGASGVGKTAAVYACAKQIGLSVLELNPSAQRSAKEVAKYGEITQSQAIRGQSKDASDAPKENNQTLNNFFKVQSKPTAKDKPATASEAQFDNTILLFEEVDIIDEEKDRGFYSALVELVKSTKRPIIVTCNNIPEELSALLNLPILQLKLRPMPKAHFLSYLKLVALCEGVDFTIQPAAHALEKFATFMKWDLRKSLLNLQFWLQQHDNNGMNSLVLKSDMDTPKDERLRLFRNNLLESCFGYAHLTSKYSNLFWTFLLGQEIPQNGSNSTDNSNDSQQQSFFSFYYNKQRQKLMQSNNDHDSPLFFSATIPKSEIQWKMEKEDTFFIAETAHLLRLDIVFNNYLQLFVEPVLPYQQALFNMKKTYEQIEIEEKIPILVLQDTPEEKTTIEIVENKPSDETSEKQPEKKSPINSPKKTTTLLNFFTKAVPTSPSKEPKVTTDQPVVADPTNVTVPEVAVEEKTGNDTSVQQLPKIVVPVKPKVSPYKEEFVIEKRIEDKLIKVEVTQANRHGELIFNDIIQLSDNISAADEMDSIQRPSFTSDKWPYDFKPRMDQSEMSSAFEILSLRTCVANTCNQDWSEMLADRSTPSSGSNTEPLETYFSNRSVNLSTDDSTAEQIHFQKKIDAVVGPLMDSLVFRLSKETCLDYTWFYQQLCFIDEDREKTNTKRRFTSLLPKFRIYANESKMLKEMSLVKY